MKKCTIFLAAIAICLSVSMGHFCQREAHCWKIKGKKFGHVRISELNGYALLWMSVGNGGPVILKYDSISSRGSERRYKLNSDTNNVLLYKATWNAEVPIDSIRIVFYNLYSELPLYLQDVTIAQKKYSLGSSNKTNVAANRKYLNDTVSIQFEYLGIVDAQCLIGSKQNEITIYYYRNIVASPYRWSEIRLSGNRFQFEKSKKLQVKEDCNCIGLGMSDGSAW